MNRKSAGQIGPKFSSESLKKEAKRWLKALRAGDTAAIHRLQRTHPQCSSTPGLRDIQHALALEHGFASWAALQLHMADQELARRSHAERVAEFLEHACLNYGILPSTAKWDPSYPDDPSRREYAARVLARHPEIVRDSIHVAVVSGDVAEVERLLAKDPGAALSKGGLRNLQPLMYLAYSRLPLEAAASNTLMIAGMLLDAGANPNVQLTDGENPFTAITGAIGEGERTPTQVPPHSQADALVRLLVERGANPFDTQALYNTSLWRDSTHWLELLYAYDAAAGRQARWNTASHGGVRQLDYLLGNSVARNHVKRAAWLLAHGANPKTRNFYTKGNLHTEAVLHGHSQIAGLLAAAGANVETLHSYQAFQAACMQLDADTANALLQQHPEYRHAPAALMTAARRGHRDAVALLLRLGVSVNIEDEHGTRALHQAAWSDDVDLAKLLIASGAEVDAKERKYHATALSWAMYLAKPSLIAYLSTVSSDIFCLAKLGDLERLAAVLSQAPILVTGKRNGATALFSLPEQDEACAVEIAELLLAHGADPRVKDTHGLTAADLAERHGMAALAELLKEACSGFASP